MCGKQKPDLHLYDDRHLRPKALGQRMFGADEILVPAQKLLDLDGIDVDQSASSVTYNHFLLQRREIIFSNGAPTESMFTDAVALKSVSNAARREITARLWSVRNQTLRHGGLTTDMFMAFDEPNQQRPLLTLRLSIPYCSYCVGVFDCWHTWGCPETDGE
jgi:hypothetical protein